MAAARKKGKHNSHQAKAQPTSFGSRTDVGLVRDHNEDSLTVTPPIFAVADGMGGHAAGEVASEIAIQTLLQNAPDGPNSDDLARAVVAANRAIIRAANEGRGRHGMGTTLTAALLYDNRLIVAQVGDSRAYLLHNGALQRITRDHSLVADLVESGQITEAEARTHPRRSVITRALGSDPNTLPDIYEMNLVPGDRLLLCSDGLSSMIEDNLIESVLVRVKDPQRCASSLVNEAIEAGGFDNVTAVVVDASDAAATRKVKREKIKGRLGAIFLAIALIAVLVGGGVGAFAYLNHTAFLTEQDGEIIICRGLPGEILGIQTWQVDHATGVYTDDLDLTSNMKDRLADEGVRVDSVADAEALLQTWQDQTEQNESASSQTDTSSSTSSSSTSSTSSSTTDASTSTSGGDA